MVEESYKKLHKLILDVLKNFLTNVTMDLVELNPLTVHNSKDVSIPLNLIDVNLVFVQLVNKHVLLLIKI